RRLGRRPGTAPGLQHAPTPRRACHRPGRHLARTPAQASLPRRDREPRLAQTPHRRAEPAQPPRKGPGPARRRLGPGHLTSQPALPGDQPREGPASSPRATTCVRRQPPGPAVQARPDGTVTHHWTLARTAQFSRLLALDQGWRMVRPGIPPAAFALNASTACASGYTAPTW